MSIKFILNPMIKEYMTDTLINNYAQEGLIILPNYINEPLMPAPLYIAPGLIFLQFSLEIKLCLFQ